MSADEYDTVQREAFGALVVDGVYGVDFSHAPANQRFFARIFDGVLRSMRCRESIAVLDCGCGPGAWLEFGGKIAESIQHASVELYGFDLTPEMVDVARERFDTNSPPHHFRPGDILDDASYDFPQHSGRFDIIFAYDVVQQLPTSLQYKACQTMMGRLADDGVMIVFDHDSRSRYGRRMAFRKFVTRYLRVELVPRYYCNAKYPPLRKFAERLTRDRSYVAEMRRDPVSNKCALILHAV